MIAGRDTLIKMLEPARRAEGLSALDLNTLWEEGFKGILIDLDNTIVPWRQSHIPEETRVFFEEAKAVGFQVCLFTNAGSLRAARISQALGIRCLAKARKPFGFHFRSIMREMRLDAAETLMIGDQIFTDMLGGNRAGCHTILLPPLYTEEFIGTRFLRLLERMLGYRPHVRKDPMVDKGELKH
jgi:HAD superfamily phosphatase (TIGR01668 family)